MATYRSFDNDFSALKLPSGQRADSLRLAPLYAELTRLGISGIDSSMGKPALLAQYAAHLQAVKAAAVEAYSGIADATVKSIIASQDAKVV